MTGWCVVEHGRKGVMCVVNCRSDRVVTWCGRGKCIHVQVWKVYTCFYSSVSIGVFAVEGSEA